MNTHKQITWTRLLLAGTAALALTGCEPVNDSDTTSPNRTSPPSSTTPSSPTTNDPNRTTPTDPNRPITRDPASPTPEDQGMSAEDTRITSEIRQAILADTALSAGARNIQIVSQDGKVTLRGQVASDMEKNDIETKVKAVSGVTSVDNQLEVNR